MDLLEIRKKAAELKKAAAGPATGKHSGSAQEKPSPEAEADSVPKVPPSQTEEQSAPIAAAPLEQGGESQAIEEPDTEVYVEYLAFMLADEEYAVKVEDMREIIRLQRVTAVPRAPEYILGITSIRGVIVPVFDIRKRLGLEAREPSRSTRILVMSDDGSPHGVIVDRVTGVVRIGKDDIEPPPAVIGGVDAEYLDGVGRASGRLLILFNTSNVLSLG